MSLTPLSPEALRPAELSPEVALESTADVEDLDGPLGQARASEALRFALGLRSDGYNVYVMGPPGGGKHELALRALARAGADAPTPSDWVYLNDFADPRRPRAVELPAGRGAAPVLARLHAALVLLPADGRVAEGSELEALLARRAAVLVVR